jgi:hypothetical protein
MLNCSISKLRRGVMARNSDIKRKVWVVADHYHTPSSIDNYPSHDSAR